MLKSAKGADALHDAAFRVNAHDGPQDGACAHRAEDSKGGREMNVAQPDDLILFNNETELEGFGF